MSFARAWRVCYSSCPLRQRLLAQPKRLGSKMDPYEIRIRKVQDDLSNSFLRLAEYLLDSYIRAAFLTATELAHELDLDPATVVRFAQRLGYSGYPHLQREIQARVQRELTVNHNAEPGSPASAAQYAFDEVIGHLEQVRRSFPYEAAEGMIASLDEAERVVVLAEGLAQPPARTLAALLESSGSTVHLSGGSPTELALAMAGARRGDLVVAIEVNEGAPYVARALREAKKQGLQTAAIVAAPSATTAKHADHVLAAHASPQAGVGLVLVESLIYALIQMLVQARPGRYRKAGEKAHRLAQRLTLE